MRMKQRRRMKKKKKKEKNDSDRVFRPGATRKKSQRM